MRHDLPPGIREVTPPWGEGLLLVCKKCQKRAGGPPVKKSLKRALEALFGRKRAPLRVASTGCLDVCPRGRVCVVATGGARGGRDRLFLVEPGADPSALLAALGHAPRDAGGRAG